MRPDIAPGGTFPDYELPDHTSTPRRLSELQGEVAVAYTQIATISTDDHHTLQEFRASVGAQWTFLSDPERMVQRDLEFRSTPTPSTTR